MSPEARSSALQRLDAYWARGRAFLGTRYAIMGGAMSWVSERNLVAAISNAGGFGVVACGSLAPDQLAAEIDGVNERCDKPFGVNIIVMHRSSMRSSRPASSGVWATWCWPAAYRRSGPSRR